MPKHDGRLRRNITVVKKRHGPHDLDVHELFIASSGISVVPYNPAAEFVTRGRARTDLAALDHVLILAPYRRDADYLATLLAEHEISVPAICADAGRIAERGSPRLRACWWHA